MCNRCGVNKCSCDTCSGKSLIYTGHSFDKPFVYEYGESFNDFVTKTMNYLSSFIVPNIVTMEFDVTPSDSKIKINGQYRNTITVPQGALVVVEVSKDGYVSYNGQYTAPFESRTYEIELEPVSQTSGFVYYWGEIGNIFAADPSQISQENWTNFIRPNGTSGGMNRYNNASSIQNSYERDATGLQLQWWIMLIPTTKPLEIAKLSSYRWEIYDELVHEYLNYDGTEYSGLVILDGVEYEYRAIRPSVITKVKYVRDGN